MDRHLKSWSASADRYLDLQLDEQKFEIVALDGMPLAYHEPEGPTRTANHLLLAPAGRLEAIVTGPPNGTHTALRTLCVDAGPDGDPHPEMVLADLVQRKPLGNRWVVRPEVSASEAGRKDR